MPVVLKSLFITNETEMPSGSINGHGRDEDSSGPVAIVAFGNALLDMSISVKDDSLVNTAFYTLSEY
jgi:hypothetical protein